MNPAQRERRSLADLLDEVGPDAPTRCAGWQARDLAAHLVVRERRPDAAVGIALPALSGHTEKVQAAIRDGQPWARLVDRIRNGPPFPVSIPALDTSVNTVEFFVHLEDVRRGRPGWTPREVDPGTEAELWRSLGLAGRVLTRRAPVGVRLEAPGRAGIDAKTGEPVVTVKGRPGEVLLWVFGRGAVADVTIDGDETAAERLAHAHQH